MIYGVEICTLMYGALKVIGILKNITKYQITISTVSIESIYTGNNLFIQSHRYTDKRNNNEA